jgi:hypothetical protein
MATPGDRIVEPSGVELLFVETAGSSGGRRLAVEWTIPAGRRLVARARTATPTARRTGPCSRGARATRCAANSGGAEAGEAWQVPTNTSHVHPWNAGDGPLRVRQGAELDLDGVLLGVERSASTSARSCSPPSRSASS